MDLKLSCSYVDDMLVRTAHHSTAIEGNTLTQYEAKCILLDGIIPRAMHEREFYEVKNYKKYMGFLTDNYPKEITVQIIRDTHGYLLQDIREDTGVFKTVHNIIVGTDFMPTEPCLVQSELKNWCDTLEYRLNLSNTMEEKIEVIMEQHLRFERIHPFSDGNGRTGRALIVHSCLQQGIAHIIIHKSDRQLYINLLSKLDIKGLTDMGIQLSKDENARMKIINKAELELPIL